MSSMVKIMSVVVALATGGGNPAGAYLRDDLIPVTGPQLGNWHEIRAPSAEHAASYLDAAIAARTLPGLYSSSISLMLFNVLVELGTTDVLGYFLVR